MTDEERAEEWLEKEAEKYASDLELFYKRSRI